VGATTFSERKVRAMPPKSNTIAGAPCWIDLSSSDLDRSIDFYREVFDWEVDIGDQALYGGYITFRKGEATVAGAVAKQPGDPTPDAWSTYLHSFDARATADAVTDAGGTNLFEPMDVPNMGWMGYATDPGGAAVGIWQPTGHHGYEAFGEPGAAVWHELHTRDFAASVTFYEEAFGWTVESTGDTDEFRYSRFVVDGVPQAGIYDATDSLAAGAPASWQVYFGARDVDHTIGRALERGAKIIEAPEDTPFGRLAGLVDPLGAYFKLTSQAEVQ
jgi:predicted enzyme related to lactoylglutathione lyase